METYTTNNYCGASSIRGSRRGRDIIGEFVVAPSCVICEKSLERKKTKNGYLEGIQHWLRRKTCGRYIDENGHLKPTACFIKYITGEGNGNYKGIMPRCKICGKKIAYYVKKEKKTAKYCKRHWLKYANKTGYFKEKGRKLIEGGYGFKKGQKSVGTPFEKGNTSWIKGKKYEDVYGITKAKKIKKILSKTIKHNMALGKL